MDFDLKEWYETLPPAEQEQFKGDMVGKVSKQLKVKPWPKQYTHKTFKRDYVPHNDEEHFFVYNDEPRYMLLKGGEGAGKSVAGIIKVLERLRRGMDGVMVCVDAETMVNNLPIADCTEPRYVDTLYGPQLASSAILEGKADLFRVVVQSGEEVTVTSDHRFLTPVGWSSLSSLHVGDVIAVHDSDYAQIFQERQPDFQDCYSQDFHPCGEYTNLAEQYDPNKSQQPALPQKPVRENEVSISSMLPPHLYRKGYRDRVYPYEDAISRHIYSYKKQYLTLQFDIFAQSLLTALLFDNRLELAADQFLYYAHTFGQMANDLSPSTLLIQEQLSSQVHQQYFEQNNLAYTTFPFYQDHKFSYNNYNVLYSKIKSITFQKYGEYYGIMVPNAGHYIANGIYHHNSPDLEHFKKSLWEEFKNWCPVHRVIDRHQYRFKEGWEPSKAFTLVFINEIGGYSKLTCGGAKESEIGGWEGPNVSFVHFDEARRHRTSAAVKVFDGRIRIPGPNEEAPQLFLTTTPRKHWLYEMWGPVKEDDEYLGFKQNSYTATVLTEENKANLSIDFAENRADSLTENEARILLHAEWEDEQDTEKFINIIWWDNCQEELPVLTKNEPAILALDAAKGSTTSFADCFALVLVTRHPNRKKDVAIRYVKIYQPPKKQLLDFGPIEEEIRRLVEEFSIVEICYDPYQLHDMAMRLYRNERIAFFKEFQQEKDRLIADKLLQSLIVSRRIAHDGNRDLRNHVDNANVRKRSDDSIRIVKRVRSLKIDAAVATSMATARCLYYNLE